MDLLRSGACILPLHSTTDSYGNTIPSRKDVVSGSTGSFENAVNFWSDDENLLQLEMANEPDEIAYFEQY